MFFKDETYFGLFSFRYSTASWFLTRIRDVLIVVSLLDSGLAFGCFYPNRTSFFRAIIISSCYEVINRALCSSWLFPQSQPLLFSVRRPLSLLCGLVLIHFLLCFTQHWDILVIASLLDTEPSFWVISFESWWVLMGYEYTTAASSWLRSSFGRRHCCFFSTFDI